MTFIFRKKPPTENSEYLAGRSRLKGAVQSTDILIKQRSKKISLETEVFIVVVITINNTTHEEKWVSPTATSDITGLES